VISTGKSDWDYSITCKLSSLAAYLSLITKASPLTITSGGTPTTGASTPVSPLPSHRGIFNDSETHSVAILNGSHNTLSIKDDHETVLVFPDYKVVSEVPRSLDGARELWRNSVNPSVPRVGSTSEASAVRSWVIPYTCVILICKRLFFLGKLGLKRVAPPLLFTGSHRRRDVRCAEVAPKLEYGAFLIDPRCVRKSF